jgi:nucleotide sugar dehydrogenase
MSTTLPGYCDIKARQASDHDFTISYNPEFIAQGSIIEDQQTPDQVLIGEANNDIGDKIQAVYEKLCKNQPVYCRMNRLSAEIAKLATNCFLTMKIAFANSIGDLSTTSGADASAILKAVGVDSRIGENYLKYGFGYGGPCFPRDNRALVYYATQYNYDLLLSEAADRSNKQHLDFQVQQYMESYAAEQPIHFHSVTYKPKTLILEESQQLAVALRLAKAGRRVIVHDEEEVIKELKNIHGDLFEYVCS